MNEKSFKFLAKEIEKTDFDALFNEGIDNILISSPKCSALLPSVLNEIYFGEDILEVKTKTMEINAGIIENLTKLVGRYPVIRTYSRFHPSKEGGKICHIELLSLICGLLEYIKPKSRTKLSKAFCNGATNGCRSMEQIFKERSRSYHPDYYPYPGGDASSQVCKSYVISRYKCVPPDLYRAMANNYQIIEQIAYTNAKKLKIDSLKLVYSLLIFYYQNNSLNPLIFREYEIHLKDLDLDAITQAFRIAVKIYFVSTEKVTKISSLPKKGSNYGAEKIRLIVREGMVVTLYSKSFSKLYFRREYEEWKAYMKENPKLLDCKSIIPKMIDSKKCKFCHRVTEVKSIKGEQCTCDDPIFCSPCYMALVLSSYTPIHCAFCLGLFTLRDLAHHNALEIVTQITVDMLAPFCPQCGIHAKDSDDIWVRIIHQITDPMKNELRHKICKPCLFKKFNECQIDPNKTLKDMICPECNQQMEYNLLREISPEITGILDERATKTNTQIGIKWKFSQNLTNVILGYLDLKTLFGNIIILSKQWKIYILHPYFIYPFAKSYFGIIQTISAEIEFFRSFAINQAEDIVEKGEKIENIAKEKVAAITNLEFEENFSYGPWVVSLFKGISEKRKANISKEIVFFSYYANPQVKILGKLASKVEEKTNNQGKCQYYNSEVSGILIVEERDRINLKPFSVEELTFEDEEDEECFFQRVNLFGDSIRERYQSAHYNCWDKWGRNKQAEVLEALTKDITEELNLVQEMLFVAESLTIIYPFYPYGKTPRAENDEKSFVIFTHNLPIDYSNKTLRAFDGIGDIPALIRLIENSLKDNSLPHISSTNLNEVLFPRNALNIIKTHLDDTDISEDIQYVLFNQNYYKHLAECRLFNDLEVRVVGWLKLPMRESINLEIPFPQRIVGRFLTIKMISQSADDYRQLNMSQIYLSGFVIPSLIKQTFAE